MPSKTIQAFISRNRVTMTAEWADSNPNMAPDAFIGGTHWRCTIRCGRRSMTVPFSQGAAHTGEPKLADVLDCLAGDAAGYVNARSLEDWCSEYGYDSDSRKAEATFKAIGKQTAALERIFGKACVDELIFNTERL